MKFTQIQIGLFKFSNVFVYHFVVTVYGFKSAHVLDETTDPFPEIFKILKCNTLYEVVEKHVYNKLPDSIKDLPNGRHIIRTTINGVFVEIVIHDHEMIRIFMPITSRHMWHTNKRSGEKKNCDNTKRSRKILYRKQRKYFEEEE